MLAHSPPQAIPDDAREASVVVSRQLTRVRRRGNAFVLQRAVYEVVALAATIAVALVGLAFVLGETSYALTVWAALAGWLWFVMRAVRRTRAAWLGAHATIELDRTAALESRLSTLVGLAERAPPSRLWPLLVRQNLDALPRWSPERITPRAVPRSLFAALAAGAALAATWLLLPDGASDGGFFPRPRPAEGPAEAPLAELPPGGGEAPASQGPLVDWSGFLASLPSEIRDEILRRARRAPPGTSPPEGARPVGRSPSRGGAAGGGPGDAEQGEGRPGEKGPGEGAGAGERPEVPMELAPGDRPRVDEGAAPPAPPKQGDGLKVLGANPDLPGLGASSSGGGPGAGAGADAEGLYGAPQEGDGPSGVFSLDLDAERGDGGEGEDESDPTRPESALAREHRVDDAVRRARVPSAYEKIVERMFQRDRQPGDAR